MKKSPLCHHNHENLIPVIFTWTIPFIEGKSFLFICKWKPNQNMSDKREKKSVFKFLLNLNITKDVLSVY